MSDHRWEEAAQKLLGETRQGKVRWRKDRGVREIRSRAEHIVGGVYVAEVQGKRIAVYEYRYEEPDPYGDDCMDQDVTIEFIDQEGHSDFVWPTPENRFELLEAIRQQETDVDGFLEKYLEHEVAG